MEYIRSGSCHEFPLSETPRSSWVALIALVLAMLIIGLDGTVLNVALPTIARELDASTTSLQWIVNIYTLVLAGLILPAGVLGDRIGRKAILLAGLAIFLIGSVAAALTTSITMLIVWRGVMGAGAAIIIPIVIAFVPLLFSNEDRPKAVGIMTASISLGLPLGPIVGGYLLNHFAWHSIFWINVPIVLVSLIAVAAFIRESRSEKPIPLDIIGTLLSVAGIVALVYGLNEAPDWGWLSGRTIAFVVGGLAILIAFVLHQQRTTHPLINLQLFRNSRFVAGMTAMALLSAVLFGLLFTLPSYIQSVRGNDALHTGIQLLPMMAGLLIAGGTSKRLLASIGIAPLVVAGTTTIAAVMLALASISPDTRMMWIWIGLGIFGLGLGTAMTAAMDAVLGSLPRDQAAAGSGIVNALRQLAGALGVAILGSILTSRYTSGLDASILDQLPGSSAEAVRDSVVGAMGVATQLGSPTGIAVRQMAALAYTDAMSVTLLVSAGLGLVAAIISGLMFRRHASSAEEDRTAARGTQSPETRLASDAQG